MKMSILCVCLGILIGSIGCSHKQSCRSAAEVCKKEHSAVMPEYRHNWWTIRHNLVNERVSKANADLIFIGDSITQAWEVNGKDVWAKYYDHRSAVNLGFAGDRTQHVLWRLQNGNIDGISPKAAVIMIGTNNSNGNDNTAEEIADGIIAICKLVRKELPKVEILLLGIFPRGQGPSEQREKIARANDIASKIADGKMIHYLDIGQSFLGPDKTISGDIMPDYLHLTEKGYEIWAQAMEPKLAELMGERK
ncbi:MAG: hypothetical protein JXB29_06740 [Sedimentisphaerales bacterium]|nr:hypothetical protein [Sedimentisphaerales bacterium]